MPLARYRGQGEEQLQPGQRCCIVNKCTDLEGTIIAIHEGRAVVERADGVIRDYPLMQLSYLPSRKEIKRAKKAIRARWDREEREKRRTRPLECVTVFIWRR